MMKTQRVCWRRALALACAVGAVPHALAQMADSTHVVGLAPQGVPPAGTAPGGPMSSQQMLNAMQGAELYFREYTDYRSGYAHLPAFVRVKVFADRAELQFHQWEAGWQRQCPVTPERPICQENQHNQPGIMKLQLMPNGFYLTMQPCFSWEEGNRTGEAHYTWEAYQGRVGAFSGQNRALNTVNNGYAGFWFQGGSVGGWCQLPSS